MEGELFREKKLSKKKNSSKKKLFAIVIWKIPRMYKPLCSSGNEE